VAVGAFFVFPPGGRRPVNFFVRHKRIMKHATSVTYVVCGTLLVASPLIYAYLGRERLSSLTVEFIVYLIMGAGIYMLRLAHKVVDPS